MSHIITIKARLFCDENSREHSQKSILYLLHAMVAINKDWLVRHPKAPSLYNSGVRYKREEGTEAWQSVDECLLLGYGDCEDLASWRTAELQLRGVRCKPFIRWRKYRQDSGKPFYLYHVLVEHANGKMEDPSKVLGMGGNS